MRDRKIGKEEEAKDQIERAMDGQWEKRIGMLA